MKQYVKVETKVLQRLMTITKHLASAHCSISEKERGNTINHDYPCRGCRGSLICSFISKIEEDLDYISDNSLPNTKKFLPYKDYLQTDHWKETRKQALFRSGRKCQLCSNMGNLHVHHNNYDNLWEETDNDLIVLCDKCHAKFHDKEVNTGN